jgi:hypothetical protein
MLQACSAGSAHPIGANRRGLGIMTTRQKRALLAILVPAEVCLAVLAWRDLDRRSEDQVRGTKHLWRLLVTINPGNSLFYWLMGRR